MKKILDIIRWIIGVLLILSSLGGLLSGDIIQALIVLSIGLIFLPPISKKIFGQNSQEKTKNNEASNIIDYSKNKTKQVKSNFIYQPIQIQRKGIQLLESLSILNTTKNIDTIKSRFEFILNIYNTFINSSNEKRYVSDIQVAVDEYKTMYYDRIINNFELKLLIKPELQSLNEYYTECLYNCFILFFSEQKFQIDNLKRESAKEKRIEKITAVACETIDELQRIKNNTPFIQLIQEKVDAYIKKDKFSKKTINEVNSLDEVLINPESTFQLTFFNSNKKNIGKAIKILKNKNIWDKTNDLFPLFAEHNIKCKEVEEYISKNKPTYINKLQEFKNNSQEYQISSEMDKLDIEIEFKKQIINELPENADCSLQTLFNFSNIDITIDDQLIKKYGFETISKYFNHSYTKDKIYTNYERAEFEDLIKADLVFTSNEIETEEILKIQTLKVLNQISEKEEGYFKRKNKAIEYIKDNKNLLDNIGKYITTRKLFKIKPLPNEFSNVDAELISNYWKYLNEYLKLISDTYNSSERFSKVLKEDNSWLKGFKIEKMEDDIPDFICQRARKECKKNYSKSNPPKLPFHIGCNCHLIEVI